MFSRAYFSPAYFPPLYFASPAAGAGGSTPTTPGPPSSTPSPTPGAVGFRDRDAYLAIVSALEATGEFAEVAFGLPPSKAVAGNDRVPLAVATPTRWEEVDDSDPIVNVRHVSYDLTLVVRGDDAAARFQELDRLTSVAQDALDGSDLGGCLPAWTKIRRGRLDPGATGPEQRVILSGEFRYLIATQAGHDTTA